MFRWYWGVFQGPRNRVAAWLGFSPTIINNINNVVEFLQCSRILMKNVRLDFFFEGFFSLRRKPNTVFGLRRRLRIIGFFDYIVYYTTPLSFTIHIITKQIKTPGAGCIKT